MLANTAAKNNPAIERAVGHWIDLAQANRFRELFMDTAEKSDSEKKFKANRGLYSFLAALNRPKNLDRFIVQANACLAHNAASLLNRILCPTLILGGDRDQIVGADAARELADGIGNSKLVVYNGFGHGAYAECPDFNKKVLQFLKTE